MAKQYPSHPQLVENFAPLRMECDLEDVVIRGDLPQELNVTYYRNGSDPQFAPDGPYHWFGGDGMIHMFRIQNGKVQYRNRWVKTKKWLAERAAGRSLEGDESGVNLQSEGLANTNVVWHGNKLLALEELHAPYELDPETLDSKGPWNFEGRLDGPMTAHPKMDPKSGEMIAFSYMVDRPFGDDVIYRVVNAAGELTKCERFKAPFPSLLHDFVATENFVVFPIFPLTGSLDRAIQGQPPFAWEPTKGTHIAVMPRAGSVDDIQWFETDPCHVFHPMNAYEDDGKLVLHMMQFEQPALFTFADGGELDPQKTSARLCEWVIDLRGGPRGVTRRYLDDVAGEFPRVDDRFAGLSYQHGFYAGAVDGDRGLGRGFDAIVHHDFSAEKSEMHLLSDGDTANEPVFVPKSRNAEEGSGFLLSIIHRKSENRSDLAVFDAQHVADGPVALAELPHRVPDGFHGNWRYNEG